MKVSFQRIISSGSFIPKIDGLRFIAILSVVLYHVSGLVFKKDHFIYKDSFNYSFIKEILERGYIGVPLFFTISGFILGMPFAKAYILNEKKPSLKNYFTRRISRLEPPYILVMITLLIGSVYFARVISLQNGLLSFVCSIFYIHNFVFPSQLPFLNCVAWSLEIEVQFYLLAPLLAYLFKIESVKTRRLVLFALCCISVVCNYYLTFRFKSLFNYLHYFLIGFFLVDLYLTQMRLFSRTKFDTLIATFVFFSIWTFKEGSPRYLEFFQLISIFLFYYYVLLHDVFNILKYKLIANIGGMCYSIYLIHFQIMSIFGKLLFRIQFSNYSFLNLSIYAGILILLIVLISSIFYLFIERPCMKKGWYKFF